MSELTPCNFCELRLIKEHAQRTGDQVTLEENPLGGLDVLVHPPGVQPSREQHLHAWFMALSNHCCC